MGLRKLVPDEDMYGNRDQGYQGDLPEVKFIDWSKELDTSKMTKRTKDAYELQKDNIHLAAQMTEVDPVRILSHMTRESGGKADAIGELIRNKDGSTENALGSMQMRPSTAADFGFSPEELLDPFKGVLAGATYLRWLDKQFDGNLIHSTSAYFDGIGNVQESIKKEGVVRKGEGNVAYLNDVLGNYGRLRDLPDDINAYVWPGTDQRPRSTGGNISVNDPEPTGGRLHTPSELRSRSGLLGGDDKSGIARVMGINRDIFGYDAANLGWYEALENASRDKNGMLGQVSDEDVYSAYAKDIEGTKPGTFHDLGKSFKHGLLTSGTSVGIALGALGSKLGIPGADGLLDSSLAATSALDKYYAVKDPNFWNTLASGFGSTVPLLLTSGIAGGLAKGVMATAIGKRLSLRFAESAVKNSAMGSIMARIGVTGAAMNLGFSSPEAAMEAGSTFKQVMDETGDENEAYRAATEVFWANEGILLATNAPLFSRMFKPLHPFLRLVAGGMLEGYQENLQENINLAAVDKKDWSGIWKPDQYEAMGVGFIIGGVLHGGKMVLEGDFKKDLDGVKVGGVTRAFLNMLETPRGAVEPGSPEGEALGASASMAASQMSEKELFDAMNDVDARLQTLGEDNILGSTEAINAEQQRLGILLGVLNREFVARDVERRMKEGEINPAEMEKAILEIVKRNAKRGGVTNHEIQQVLFGIHVLGRMNALTEETMKAVTDAFPIYREALDVFRQVEALKARQRAKNVSEGDELSTVVEKIKPKIAGLITLYGDDLKAMGVPDDMVEAVMLELENQKLVSPDVGVRGRFVLDVAEEEAGPEEEGRPTGEPPAPAVAPPEESAPPTEPEPDLTEDQINENIEQAADTIDSTPGILLSTEDEASVKNLDSLDRASKLELMNRLNSLLHTTSVRPTVVEDIVDDEFGRGQTLSTADEELILNTGYLPAQGIPNKLAKITQYVETLAKAFGVRVLWVKDGAETSTGMYLGATKTAMLNLDKVEATGESAVNFVLAHELGHHISNHVKLRPLMRDLLARISARSTTLQAKIDGKRISYRTQDLTEEVIADLLMLELVNPENESLVLQHISEAELNNILSVVRTFLDATQVRLRKDEKALIGRAENEKVASQELALILESRLQALEARLNKLSTAEPVFASPTASATSEPLVTRARAIKEGVKKGHFTMEQLDSLPDMADFMGNKVYYAEDLRSLMFEQQEGKPKSKGKPFRKSRKQEEERVAKQKAADKLAAKKAKPRKPKAKGKPKVELSGAENLKRIAKERAKRAKAVKGIRKVSKPKDLIIGAAAKQALTAGRDAETPEGRAKIRKAIDFLQAQAETIRTRQTSGVQPNRESRPVVKSHPVTGKPMMNLSNPGYGWHQVRYVDQEGNHNTEDFTNKRDALKRMDQLETAKINPQEEDRRNLRRITSDIEELRSALTRSGLDELAPTPDVADAFAVERQEEDLTEEQEEALVQLKDTASRLEEEEAARRGATKLTGNRPYYPYGEGSNVESRTQENIDAAAAREKKEGFVDLTFAQGFIAEMNKGADVKVSEDILETEKVEKLDVGIEGATLYSFDDLIKLFSGKGRTAQQTAVLAYTVAVNRAKASRASARKQIEVANTQSELARDDLRELDDWEWLGLFESGTEVMRATDRQPGGEQTPLNVQWARENLIEADRVEKSNIETLAEQVRKAAALQRAEGRILERIAELYAALRGHARKYITAVEADSIEEADLIRESIDRIQEELGFLSGLNTAENAFNPVTAVIHTGQFIGDLFTGNYKTGRPRSGKVKIIDPNAAVQAEFETQTSAHGTVPDPSDPRRTDSPRRRVNELYRDGFDSLHMVKVAQEDAWNGVEGGKALAMLGQNFYQNMRGMAKSWSRVVDFFLENSVVSFKTKEVLYERGVKQILKKYGFVGNQEKYERLRVYMVAKKIVMMAINERHKFQGTDIQVQAYIDKHQALYDTLSHEKDLVDAAHEFSEYSFALLKFMNEMGVLSDQELKDLRRQVDENGVPYYSPLYKADRVTSAALVSDDVNRDAEKGIKPMGLLDLDAIFMHPVEAITRNTIRYVNVSYMNHIKLELGNMLKTIGRTSLGHELDLNPTSLTLRRSASARAQAEMPNARPLIKAKIEEARVYYGIPGEKVDSIVDIILSPKPGQPLDPDAEMMKLYLVNAELGSNMVAYLEGGEFKILSLHKDIIDAFASLEANTAHKIVQVAGALTNMLKKGATRTPDFAVRNTMRDFVANLIGVKNMVTDPATAGAYLTNWVYSVMELVTGRPGEYQRGYIMQGGALGEFMGLGDDRIKDAVNELMRSPWTLNPKDALPAMWHGYKALISASETATRLAVYRTRFDQIDKQNPGMSYHIISQLAGFDSREGNVDFARMGSAMRSVNNFQPFFTASVGGTDKMVRSLFGPKADPGAWARGFMLVTLPTLALYWRNHDEEWYINQPSWKKNLFWLFKVGDQVISIPKPFEYGLIFASLPERIMDYLIHDQDMFEARNFASLLSTQMYGGSLNAESWMFGMVPPLSNLAAMKVNYDPFRQQNIVKGVRAELEAPYQYSDSTSAFFRWLSMSLYENTPLRLSPAKLDFYVRGSFGGVGKYAVDLLSFATKKISGDPRYDNLVQKDWYNRMPVIKGFASRDSQAFGRWSDQFYEIFEDARRADKTQRYVIERKGDREAAIRELELNGGLAAIYPALVQITEMTKGLTMGIESVKANTTLTPIQRRKFIDQMNSTRGELYRRGVLMALEFMPKAQKATRDAARSMKQED